MHINTYNEKRYVDNSWVRVVEECHCRAFCTPSVNVVKFVHIIMEISDMFCRNLG